ncbi:DNRLRE domain-containing protein [Clostridium lacusfryxellense]|uniref:DNRLRE domain-containing protein n=1 Tax=Clostridium lacusfryxellense TaxID=205328 RepID=UPI001C0C7BB7|nr:DNRLRE domain-containing protein [Clostridium lacusfryxellense]MBU3114613.1 DNRLRE domain-containing protein [Clostridium lacusfryxellense]
MLVACFPTNSFALESTTNPNPVVSNTADTGSGGRPGKIVKEIIEKRAKNTKQFLKDDGTYEAVLYSSPVHYLDKGLWKDIDNSLSEVSDGINVSKKVLSTKENDYKVKIDKNADSKKLVSIVKGKYEVEWNVDKANGSDVKINPLDQNTVNTQIEKEINIKIDSEKDNIKNKAVAKSILIENEKKKTLDNIASQVTFNNIFTNIDLQYIINSDKVKENIIINKPGSVGEVSFNLKAKNLKPEIQKNNSIIFYDINDSKKAIFEMQSPFMIDANKENSNNIGVALEENKDGYKLTLKPDANWLNDSSRAYPVVLDPPISTSLDVNSIHDTFVSQNNPSQNNYTAVSLGVGKGSLSGVTRSFIKFDLPALTSGSIVTSADLKLALYTTNTNTRQINVNKVNSNWDSSTLTWSNAPSFDSVVQDYQLVNGDANSFAYFNATNIVKEWYNTGNNYGLMLKNNDETVGYNEFYSSDCSTTYAAYRPQITLNYINNSGLESYWTYHSQSVNRAGTGYINDYNGNLTFVHDDLSMSGNKMPVNVNHVYNSNDRSTGFGYGNGWRLNLNQKVTVENIGGSNYYCYTDEDGTKHYFFYDAASSTYKDETGLNITLTLNADSTYTVKDKGGNQLIFTSNGYLSKNIDNNGNTSTLTYNGVVLKQITDGAGRITLFDSTAQGNLLGITDPAGRRTSFAYNGVNLQTITYPDGKVTTYNYDANNNLISAVNYDGYKVTYTYNAGAAHRVTKVLESHTDGTLGDESNIAYGNNLTSFTDVSERKDIFQFNDSGNTVSTRDSQGNANYTKYTEQTNDANKNKTTLDSKIQKTTVNYLKNHSAEYDTDWSYANESSSTGSGGFSIADKYIGKRSLTINKTNISSRSYIQQSLTLEKGKTYTYSGYIKTNAVSNNSGKGAHLLINYKNSAGTWLEANSSYVSGTIDWARYEVTFTIPSDALTADVIVKSAVANETGTAYFDSLQLEDGSVANRYNLIENADFRNGSFTNWVKNIDCDASDALAYMDPSADANYTSANIDRNYFKINGDSGKNKNISQTVNVSGNLGDTFVLSGWAKANSVPLASGRSFAISVGVKGLDGTWQWITVPFNKAAYDWQYISSVIKTDRAYQSINVYGMYYDNANTACFDGFRLYKEEFGDSYIYDSNGNLSSATDIAKQKSNFVYNTTNDQITSSDPKGSATNDEYDSKHNITKTTTAENVVQSFTYDSSGNKLTTKVGDSTLFINSSTSYTASGNYINSTTDSSGNILKNNWDETKGLLNSFTDANNKTTSYTYDNNTDDLLSVSKTADGQQVKNIYNYLNDKISSITNNGFSYNFGYDSLGNNTTVSVGNQNIITNSYELRTGKLLKSNYGNGQEISSDYDSLNRVSSKKYNGILRYNYEYDSSGNIGYQKDLINGTNYRYFYDISNRLVQFKDSLGNILSYNYDDNNNNSKISDKINGTTYDTSYGYDKDNKQNSIIYSRATSNTISQSYDKLGRLSVNTVNTGTANYGTSYGYTAGVNDSTTEKIGSITNNGNAISYTYDTNGNISTSTQNSKVIKYYYNELNELTREDNQVLNKTITSAYDLGGNKTVKTEYPYTTGTLGTATVSYPYVYGDTNWKDKLTSYNGNAITYDSIGNPLTYNGNTYTWEEGRKLAGLSGNGNAISYKYNDSGIRTSKTVNGVKTSYHLVGNKVTYETNGTDIIYYTYDSSDSLVSMSLNGVEYYYIKNAQRDIIGLFDKSGTEVVNYTYDSWGKLISTTGSLASTVGVKNPYRYRGYYYDNETSLYYLQSRYYNADWGRFVNPDSVLGNPGQLLSYNLYSYCENNPVNNYDPDGHALIGALVGAGFGALLGKAIANYYGLHGWKKTATIAGCLVGGAAIGWYAGAIVAKLANRIMSSVLGSLTLGGACFTSGTQILTEYGHKSIENIKIGDYVYSENPQTAEKGLKRVENIFIREVNSIVKIEVDGEKINTTTTHPFFVVGKGWVKAGDLKVGEKLLLFSNKEIKIEKIAIEKLNIPVKVYNFEVQDWHTYFVSNTSILVHNACQDRGMIQKIGVALRMTNTERRNFGSYVEEYKHTTGIPNNGTLSWGLLKALAKQFLGRR